jgi:molybdopterin-guanine dinucleotide biosynthesis protein A
MSGLTGLVLCGGRGTRMGRDKALLEVEGEPLVLRVARSVAGAADPVLLATGVPGRLGDLGYAEVADEQPGAGPLAGLVAGLGASPHPLLVAVAVDMPFASPEVLRLLAVLHAGEDAVVPVTASGTEPLHAAYARAALPALRMALAERRLALRAVLSGLRVREVHEPEWRAADPTGRFALNLNRTEDLPALGLGRP